MPCKTFVKLDLRHQTAPPARKPGPLGPIGGFGVVEMDDTAERQGEDGVAHRKGQP